MSNPHPDSTLMNGPYPIHPGEMITGLDPKNQGEFPDPVRFPPPPGSDGKCGCLMVTYKDVRQEHGVLLECIWQPWWDTKIIPRNHYGDAVVNVDFFQQGEWQHIRLENGRRKGIPYGETNLETAGQMTWPKRFHLWEFELQFSRAVNPLWDTEFVDRLVQSMMFTFVIGEKNHFKLPVSDFFRRANKLNAFYAPIPLPLFIPPIQNFRARIEIDSSKAYPKPEAFGRFGHLLSDCGEDFYARCILHGYLSREIP